MNENLTEAQRIGARIREIRGFERLTMTEFGEKIGLNADRVQKYENGQRKPKSDMVSLISDVFDVPVEAIYDPNSSSPLSAVHGLMEMEDYFGAEITKLDDGSMALKFDRDSEVYDYLALWYEEYRILTNALESCVDEDDYFSVKYPAEDHYKNFKMRIGGKNAKKVVKKDVIDEIERLKKVLDELEA